MDGTHSFGYWLRRRRKALDLTQAALAQRVSCSLDLIQMHLRGEQAMAYALAATRAEPGA